jgi:hypothetical protein
MNENLNLAEILKDCPKGMELDCAMYEGVTLIHASDGNAYPIKIKTPDGQVSLDKYGRYSSNKHAKCVIFPKGKTTWEGFVPPYDFKDGDVIYVRTMRYNWVSIFKKYTGTEIFTYTDCNLDNNNFHGADNVASVLCLKRAILEKRIATEEEKEKLFQAIKEHGYTWNAEKKTLEKLVEPKFDPATLKPFDRVLVRNVLTDKWRIGFFEKIDTEEPKYDTVCSSFRHCIPYLHDTKHLLGKAEMEPEYYQVDEYLL